jgi:hypothetical protein
MVTVVKLELTKGATRKLKPKGKLKADRAITATPTGGKGEHAGTAKLKIER